MKFELGDLVIGNEERTLKLMNKYGVERKTVELKVLKVIEFDHSLTSGRMLLEYKGRRATFKINEFRLATEGEIKKQSIREMFKK